MWLGNETRPDIHNAVRAVAHYCRAPTLAHLKAAVHILMYVQGMTDFGIQDGYSPENLALELWADSDLASQATSRRSVSGGLVMCGGGSVPYF